MEKQGKKSFHLILFLVAGVIFSLLLSGKLSSFYCIENNVVGLIGGLFLTSDLQASQSAITIPYTDLIYSVFFITIVFLILFFVWCNYRGKWKVTNANRKELETILSHIPMPVFIISKDNKLKMMNDAAGEIVQCTNQQWQNQDKNKDVSMQTKSELAAILAWLDNQEKQATIELKGRRYKMDIANFHLTTQTGDDFILVLQDVTQAFNIQSKLEEKTIELETISENLLGGVLVTEVNDDFTVIRCNPGYLELIGIEEDDLKGTNAMQWVATEDSEFVRKTILEHVQNNESVNIEHRIYRKNKEKIWVSLYGKKTVLNGHEVGIWMIVDINQRKETQQQLIINEERYRIALENTEDIILDYDIKTKSMYHSLKVTEVYGVDQVVPNAPEVLPTSGIIDQGSVQGFLNSLKDIESGKPNAVCVLKTFTKDKQVLWKRLLLTTIFNEEKQPERAIGILQDITREQEANLQYQKEAHYREVTMKGNSLYYEANISRKIFTKGHESLAMKILGYVENDFDTIVQAMIEHIVYTPDRVLVHQNINSDYLLEQAKQEKTKVEFEYRRIADGKATWVLCTIYLLNEEEGVKALCYIKDNDEVKQKELALKQKAEKDLLTGLLNKVTTENKIDEWLQDNVNSFSALLLIDLDNFKNFNDTLGHAFGDAILSEVSRKLSSCFSELDICGRIGGDEFIVFLTQVSTIEEVTRKAQHLCKELANFYNGHSQNQQVSISVGIASTPKDGCTFQQLYQKSDVALYHSKNQGKNRFSVYSQDLPRIDERNKLVTKQIDENSGKAFSENIVEYVLRILYGAPNPILVIPGILELVSKSYGFHRGYLFELSDDQTHWKQSQEWCAQDVTCIHHGTRNIDEKVLKEYLENFDQEGIFIVRDGKKLDEPFKTYFAKIEVESFIQFLIVDNGEAKAIIGFEDCFKPRPFEENEINPLHMISMMIATALINYKKK